MKTTTKKLPIADDRLPIERQNTATSSAAFASRKSSIGNRAAFTLIELLVVIAVIAIIAAFTLSVTSSIKKQQYLKTARAEMDQIATALENYKAQFGVYPPGNANTYAPPLTNSLLPQLYYELAGVTNNNGTYYTLDGASQILATDVQKAFGVGGFINCAKPGDEESAKAKSFLLGLKANRVYNQLSNNTVLNTAVLITSVRGPDASYQPLGVPDVNPFRYVYPGVNNPNSYDLWIQLVFNGKTNLVCNWSKSVQINSALP